MTTKTDNIAEYLLHLWQMEDVVRAFQHDEVLAQNPFLGELLTMMQTEGVLESGHTQLAQIAFLEVQEAFEHCLDDATFRALYLQIQPSLALLKAKSPNPTISDLEMMFIFLYNIMLLHLQKKPISPDTTLLQQQVSHLLALVSKTYHDAQTDPSKAL